MTEWLSRATNSKQNSPNSVQRERESLREDAARYQFLKDQNDDKHSQFVARLTANYYGLEWDSKIDAAMKGQ